MTAAASRRRSQQLEAAPEHFAIDRRSRGVLSGSCLAVAFFVATDHSGAIQMPTNPFVDAAALAIVALSVDLFIMSVDVTDQFVIVNHLFRKVLIPRSDVTEIRSDKRGSLSFTLANDPRRFRLTRRIGVPLLRLSADDGTVGRLGAYLGVPIVRDD